MFLKARNELFLRFQVPHASDKVEKVERGRKLARRGMEGRFYHLSSLRALEEGHSRSRSSRRRRGASRCRLRASRTTSSRCSHSPGSPPHDGSPCRYSLCISKQAGERGR